jgi:translation initiation factor eIF-2B subunit gamma
MNDLISRSTPKCLLPIGNRPMIYYPVRMLEMAGFREVIILTSESIKSRIKEELVLKHGIQCNLVIVGIDDTKEELDDLGTAESLRFLKEKLISDCMIVSCDLISSVNIQKMANFYRANDAAFVMLLSDISDQNYIEQSSLIGSKGKYASEKDVVGYDPATNRLLHFRAKTDVEDDGGIKLKKSILNRYPSIAWTIRLQDAHFYIIKKWLIDFVIDNPK